MPLPELKRLLFVGHYSAPHAKRKARIQGAMGDDPDFLSQVCELCCKDCGPRWGSPDLEHKNDVEERVKLLAIRLAVLEKVTSRIEAVALGWGWASVLGAFGYLLKFSDFCVVAFILFAETYRLFFRSFELQLGSLLRAEDRNMSSGETPARRSHSNNDYVVVTAPKRDLSIVPVPFFRKLSDSWGLSCILYGVQRITGGICIGLSIYRLVAQDSCPDDDNGDLDRDILHNCRVSTYYFYAMAILGASLFLIEKGLFDYQIYWKGRLIKMCRRFLENKVDRLVLENFLNAVYRRCLEGSIYDGFDINLTNFGIQWLLSDDFEKQEHGAKLIHGLILARNADKKRGENSQVADKHRLSSRSANSLKNLGTYPGLMKRLVAMLSWKSEHEEAFVDEIAAIICDLVAFDQNCSSFANVPGAVEAVVSVLKSRAGARENRVRSERSKGTNFKTPLLMLRSLAAIKSTSGATLRQQLGGEAKVLGYLEEGVMNEQNPELQLLSTEILFHLALDENARRSIGETETIIQSLLNLFEPSDSLLVRREPESHVSSNVQPETVKRAVMAGMALSRLMVQNEANCRTLVELKRGEVKPFGRLIEESVRGDDVNMAAIAAEISHTVWAYADESFKTRVGAIVLKKVVKAEISDKTWYTATLGLASCIIQELPLEVTGVYREELQTHFVNQLVENLKDRPTISEVHESTMGKMEIQLYFAPPLRRYSIEMIRAVVERKYLSELAGTRAENNLRNELKQALTEARDCTSGVENFILVTGMVGCARYPKDIKVICDEALVAVDALCAEYDDAEQ